MIPYIKIIVLFTLAALADYAYTQEQLTTEIALAEQQNKQQAAAISHVAQKLLTPAPGQSITSIHTEAITSLFGPSGLNVQPQLLTYINYFYFYLEYVVKRERAAQLITLAQQSGKAFPALLATITNGVVTYDWGKLVASQAQAQLPLPSASSWDLLDSALRLSYTQEHKSWDTLIDTSFWTALTVTTSDIVNSSFWQNYAKFIIKKTIDLDQGLLVARYENERSLFKYLPTIEVAYFNPDFTQLRLSSQITQASLIVSEHTRNRMLAQCTDWRGISNANQLLKAIAAFTATPFYTTAATLSDITSRGATSPFQLDADNKTITFKNIPVPSPTAEQVTCLSMLLTLQALTADLFQGNALDATMRILRVAKQQPSPSFLPYTPNDYNYLLDIRDSATTLRQLPQASTGQVQTVQQTVLPAAQSTALTTAPATAVVQQATLNWVKATGSDVWRKIQQTGEALYASAQDVAEITKDETLTLYYSSGLAQRIQSLPPQTAQQLAQAYQDAARADFSSFQAAIKTIITNAVILTPYGYGGLYLVMQAIGTNILHDPKLSTDVNMLWSSLIDTVADVIAAPFEIGGLVFQNECRLSIQAISLISNVVLGLSGPQTLGPGFRQLGLSILSSVLSEITFIGAKAAEAITSLIQTCGYLIKLLTDLVIDIGAGVEASIDYVAYKLGGSGLNFATYYAQAQTQIGTHRRLIAQVITTGLIVGLTVATGGTGVELIPGLVLALGFGSLMITSGAQEDIQVEQLKQETHEYVQNFRVWTQNKEAITTYQQTAISTELNKKFEAELSNRERMLGFYENFLNSTFNGLLSQKSSLLGSYQAALLTPQPYAQQPVGAVQPVTMTPGDIGSLYGYRTGWLNLNPSQGFAIYAPSRQKISQEIAVSPASVTVPGGQASRFWFLQNSTKDLDQNIDQPLSVELRFKPIYLLQSFYAGLYLGGNPLNQAALMTTRQADPDRAHLAKMIVFKKESATLPVSLGIYEHESDTYQATQGWIPNNFTVPPFNIGTWYHIRATLNARNLTVQVWREGDPLPPPVTLSITPTSQKTMGIIFTGASLEGEILTPNDQKTYQVIDNVYPPYQGALEVNREKTAQATFSSMQHPEFGSFSPTALDTNELLKENYIYTTRATPLAQQMAGKLPQDYVIFGNVNQTTPPTVTDLGASPSASPTGLISLISGDVFDASGTQLPLHLGNVWNIYKNARPTISTANIHQINTAQTTHAQALLGPYKFDSFTLSATGIEDIQQGNFIYTTTTSAVPKDYVLMAPLNPDNTIARSPGTGVPYNPSITGMVSLVSGLLYSKASTQPIESGYTDQLSTYQQVYGPLRKELVDAIETAQAAYQKTQQATQHPAATKPSAPLAPPPISTNEQNISTPQAPPSTIINVPPPPPPAQSISQRQVNASDNEGGW